VHPPHQRRKIDLQASLARTAEGAVIGKNNVAAFLADETSLGHHAHGMKLILDDAIGTP
jgi:hypothetical protein